MNLTDLHIHSIYSDGEMSPEEIFDIAEEKMVSIFSITDHNYIYPNINNLKAKKTQFIQGIEISSFDSEKKLSLHILGYSLNFNIDFLNKNLESIIAGYNRRAKKIIKKLNLNYKNLDLDFNMLMDDKKTIVSRNDIAMEFLKQSKAEIPFKDAVSIAYVEEDTDWMLTPEEAIGLIVKSGGVPVLAHPGRLIQSKKNNFNVLIKDLKDTGLQGLEVYYSSHTKDEEYQLKNLCKEYSLITTCGNDWHGVNFTLHKKIGRNIAKREVEGFLKMLK